jgi:type II secretory ATPase GspE/PulE/Tfp pilus assembly ATPase PilB-like protein
VFEVLVLSDAFRAALRGGAPLSELRAIARVDGHRELATQLDELTRAGRLSPAESARILS